MSFPSSNYTELQCLHTKNVGFLVYSFAHLQPLFENDYSHTIT